MSDESLGWGLSCALWDAEQHPWPLPARRQRQCGNPKCLQTLPMPSHGQNRLVESQCPREQESLGKREYVLVIM